MANHNHNLSELTEKLVYFFDLDGTIYLGNKLFEGVLDLIEILRIGSKKLVLLPIEIYKNERYLTGHYILVTSLSKAGLLTVHDPNEHDSVVVPLRKFFPSNVGGITVDRVNKIKYKVRFDVGIITLGYRGPGGRRE